MKKTPIRILLLLFLSLELFATSYEWRVSANKERAYVNEAIYLDFVCEFSDGAELYAVEFDPLVSDENLTIKLLSETRRLEDDKKVLEYEFVAFVHKPGERVLAFEALMKKTTQDSIRDTIIGRDNEKYAEYQSTNVPIKSVAVDVLEANTSLVGEFTMHVKNDAAEVKALTPYHFEVRIDGLGNFEKLTPLAFEIEGVKVFSEEPVQKTELTPEGYKGSWTQKFAFVSEKSFRLQPFTVNYLSPKTRKIKDLRFDGIDVRVQEGYKKEALLDVTPEEKMSFNLEYLYYFLTFIAGYLLSKLELTKRFKRQKNPWCKKIQNATSLDALSVLLILEDAKKYEKILQEIETKELTSLRKAKRLICA